MSNSLEAAIRKIDALGNEYCVNQMYRWPGFDPRHPDPATFFSAGRIEFDGDLFIRYRVKETFNPLSVERIEAEEGMVGASLPNDYKVLLQTFGEFHLPGAAGICIESPAKALKTTRGTWRYEGEPLRALAISSYNDTSDGNSIGFIRDGDSFQPALFELCHELRSRGDDPSLWTKKLGDSLSDFLLEYLERDK